MLMKTYRFIFKKNEEHNHIGKQWTLIMKTSTLLKNKQNKYNSMEDNIWSYRRGLFWRIWYFSRWFYKKIKDNANESQWVPLEVKNYIKLMATEQGLYAQVVMLCWKGFKCIAAYKNKNEAKFKLQGQSEISQRWFDLDFDWNEVNVCAREPDFYNKNFQNHDDTQDTKTFKLFQVPIRNSNVWKRLSFKMMPQCSSIVRSRWIYVVSVV